MNPNLLIPISKEWSTLDNVGREVNFLDVGKVGKFQSRTSSQVHQRWNPRDFNIQETAKDDRRPQRMAPAFLRPGLLHPAQLRKANVGE